MAIRSTGARFRRRASWGVLTHAAAILGVLGVLGMILPVAAKAARPNILWISMEDISPDFGCYGVQEVVTPNVDALAARGVRYAQAYATAGVCAPSRSAIITGVYQMAIGTQHMRSEMPKPAGHLTLPEVMRRAGYYCTNSSKQDYNFDGRGMWDANGGNAHWRQRAPQQPFFSVFNFVSTHESQAWKLGEGDRQLQSKGAGEHAIAPAKLRLPSYYADTPRVREHLANYYNLITAADLRVGEILADLKADGLADDTLVFVWGDHGRGLPRGKYWSYTVSTRVPLIVYVPPKFHATLSVRPGTVDENLRSLLDLFPSVLAAAGVSEPPGLQGRSLFGDGHATLLAGRDRLGARQDLTRAIRTKEWLYIRNFVHDDAYIPRAGRWYNENSPIQVEMWRRQAQLTHEQATFFSEQARPAEELYSLANDAEETRNLASDPASRDVVAGLRRALREKMAEIGDSGFVPEHQLYERLTQLHARGENPLRQLWLEPPAWLFVPEPATPDNIARLMRETHATAPERRYWALRELLNAQEKLTEAEVGALAPLLEDPSIDIRLQAVRLMLSRKKYDQVTGALEGALAHPYAWSRTVALGIIEAMPDDVARRFASTIEQVKPGGYVGMLRPYLLARFKGAPSKAEQRPK